jgi:hypothetical protein
MSAATTTAAQSAAGTAQSAAGTAQSAAGTAQSATTAASNRFVAVHLAEIAARLKSNLDGIHRRPGAPLDRPAAETLRRTAP